MASTRVLIVYHSSEGQTRKVAARIGTVMRSHESTVEVEMPDRAPSPIGFDGVVVGGSVHAGRHDKALTRYLAQYAKELDDVPVALFQVSLTSATDDEEHATEAHRLIQQLIDATDLDPDLVGLFAGALKYTQYGWLKRGLMRHMTAKEGGDTDTTRDFEYTDWPEVDHFALDALDRFRVGQPTAAKEASLGE